MQDAGRGIVSNRLIFTGLMTGMAVQLSRYGGLGIIFFLRNISVPVIVLYLLFQMRVLGAGDIKLFSMIGSMVTLQELYRSMVFGFVAGGLFALIVFWRDPYRWKRLFCAAEYLMGLLRDRQFRPYVPPGEKALTIPFAVPVCIGTVFALYVGIPV